MGRGSGHAADKLDLTLSGDKFQLALSRKLSGGHTIQTNTGFATANYRLMVKKPEQENW
jgi:hypothetical protein